MHRIAAKKRTDVRFAPKADIGSLTSSVVGGILSGREVCCLPDQRQKLIWTDEFHGGDHAYVEGHQ